MNIKRAKQEIIDAVEAYLSKDEYGDWLIPRVRQRPILLLGAPGIGKTHPYLEYGHAYWRYNRRAYVRDLADLSPASDFSSAALSSIDVATATPHSSALHMKKSSCINIADT